MKAHFSVPLVDISAYVVTGTSDARRVVATQLEQACRTVGFMQVRGHGIADATIDGLTSAMDAFFVQPLEWKKSYRAPPEINRGYTPPHSESLALSLGLASAGSLKDYFEAFNIGVPAGTHPRLDLPRDIYAGNPWPVSCAGFDGQCFRTAVEDYFTEAGRVARTLCRIFADALGVDPDLFTSVTDHSADVLRMNNYALPPGSVVGEVNPLGMGAHTDYGIVTVLWADRVPGLQVLGPDGLWQDVQPAEGTLLVNLGDLTARWTNDRWLSTLHRVNPPVVDGVIQPRRSAAYFHDGNIDAVISTIPTCVGRDGRQYPPISIGDHLSAKLHYAQGVYESLVDGLLANGTTTACEHPSASHSDSRRHLSQTSAARLDRPGRDGRSATVHREHSAYDRHGSRCGALDRPR